MLYDFGLFEDGVSEIGLGEIEPVLAEETFQVELLGLREVLPEEVFVDELFLPPGVRQNHSHLVIEGLVHLFQDGYFCPEVVGLDLGCGYELFSLT